jgi:protoporphyrinogen oxidase
MNTNIVIIGSGIAGLYSAYTIKKNYPLVSFIILEKFPKKHVGGRIGNDTFYGTEIVRGAGIGRTQKDILLQQLLAELDIPIHTFQLSCDYSPTIDSVVNIDTTIKRLKTEFLKNKASYAHLTFSQFAKKY